VAVVFLISAVLKGPMWVVTAPSLRERRDKKRAEKQARLRDLDKQIAQAEAELNATGHADWAATEGTQLTKYGPGIDFTAR
jgi:hypothetical protein